MFLLRISCIAGEGNGFSSFFAKKGRITLSWKFMDESSVKYLWIRKYFTDNSSVNLHDKVFFIFCQFFEKTWRKTLSWKFMDESSIKYLQIHKWGRWIWPMSVLAQNKSRKVGQNFTLIQSLLLRNTLGAHANPNWKNLQIEWTKIKIG